jgi:hypothetical protein
MRYRILVVLFFGSLFFSLKEVSHAQTQTVPLDATVSPTFFDLTAKPGDTIHNKLRIRNNASSPIDLTVTAKKLISSTKDGQPVPADPQPGDSFISWITFDHDSFTAAPQEWTTVNFTITVPKDAAFGYYYVIQIAPKNAVQVHGVGAKVQGQILSAILLNVAKNGAKAQLQLTNFTPVQFVNEFLPVTFSTEIANTGNVHIRPQGNIFIRNDLQKDLGVLDINPNLGAILPQGKRTFTADWNDGFLVREPIMENNQVKTDVNGKPITHLVINWNKLTDFRIGKYTASLLVVYDDGKRDQTLEASTDFWVIPYTAIALFVGGLLILFIVLRLIIKSYVKSQIRKYQKK